jgi:F0F1-type ATP synthase membrane subunit c/vacuolar-type H+-ATPase subunit K
VSDLTFSPAYSFYSFCSGLIVSVIITQSISSPDGSSNNTYSVFNGYAHVSFLDSSPQDFAPLKANTILLKLVLCQLAAGLCCGLSGLAAGGTIGVIGEVGVQCFGQKASGGKRSWLSNDDDGGLGNSATLAAEDANKLYVGLLIMLIFSEALALYGLIVALILSQHSYVCGKD